MAVIGTLVVQIDSMISGAMAGFGQVSQGIAGMETRMATAGAKMRSVGGTMSTAITLPLIAAGAVAIKTGADFERTMNSMAAVAGVPGPQLVKLRQLAMDLGAATVFSANEAGQAMLELSKSGVSTADIMGGALKNALDLASAGDLQLADAANITANAMNTFGLSGKQTRIAVDALAGAANASSANVSDLALALSQVGAVAAMTGQSIQQTTAFLAAMADKGIRGSDAGTSLKTMLLQLQPVTKKQKETMNELGISFVNANGTFMNLTQIAGVLQSRMSGLTDSQRQLALKTMFGTDAVRAATVAYELGSTGMQKMVDSTSKVGNASEVAAGKMKGLPGVIEQFKGSLETAALSASTKMAPSVERIMTALTGLLNAFTALPGPVMTAIVAGAALLAVIGPLLVGFGMLLSALPAIGTAFGALGTAIRVVVIGLRVLFVAMQANPFILLITAIVALAIIVVKNWDTIKAAFSAAAAWMGQKLKEAAAWLGSFVAGIWAWAGQVVAAATSAGSRFLGAIGSFLAQLPGVVISWLGRVVAAIWAFPGQAAAAAARIGASMREAISSAIAGIPGLVSGILRNAVNGIGDWAGAAFAAMRRVAAQMWAGFKAGLGIKSPSLITRAVWQISDEVSTSAAMVAGEVRGLLDTTRSFARVSIGDLGARAAIDAARALAAVQTTVQTTVPAGGIGRAVIASPSGGATTPAPGSSGRPIQIANLNVSLDARLDWSNPTAVRQFAAQLRQALVGLEREGS